MSDRVNGTVAPGWEPVKSAFIEAFDSHPAMGGGLAIVHRGQMVVDLWGGLADPRSSRPWQRDTLSVVFSATKGIVSLLVARLVQQGALNYDDRVVTHWPEFGSAGKEHTRVSDLLAHRAGLSAPRHDMSVGDILQWERVIDVLAAQEPLWTPGDGWAYHAITHGWLAGELVRRATGLSVGGFLRQELAEIAPDTWIGLPASEQQRVAYLSVGPTLRALTTQQLQEQSDPDWLVRAMTLGGALPLELVTETGGFNDARVRSAEIPAAGGIGTARDLASVWAATVSGDDPLLTARTREVALTVQSDGPPVFDVPPPWPRWGMGFQLDSEARRYLTESSFGHDGAGGQVAFADPIHELGFAFVTNWMEADDPRATHIIDVLRELLSP